MLRWAWRQLTSMRTALFLLLLLAVGGGARVGVPAARRRRRRAVDALPGRPPRRWRRGWTGSACSTSTPRPGSPRSTCCCSSRWSAASCPAPACTWRAMRAAPAARARAAEPAARARSGRGRRRRGRRGAAAAARRCCGAGGTASRSATAGRLRRARLPARDRQPGVPRRAARRARRRGRRLAVRLPGPVLVVDGHGFANTLSAVRHLRPRHAGSTTPTCRRSRSTLDDLNVAFETEAAGNQFAAPRDFEAAVTVRDEPGAEPSRSTIRVNSRCRCRAPTCTCSGNGYAPVITVRDGDGAWWRPARCRSCRRDASTPRPAWSRCSDATRSSGCRASSCPRADMDPERGPVSVFPDALDPALVLHRLVRRPRPGRRAPAVGVRARHHRHDAADRRRRHAVRRRARHGESVDLPDGGQVTFDGSTGSRRSTSGTTRRRSGPSGSRAARDGRPGRLAVRPAPAGVGAGRPPRGGAGPTRERGRTVVEVAALARSEDPRLQTEVQQLAAQLRERLAVSTRADPGSRSVMSVDTTLAQLSNVLVYSAMAAYAGALLGYAVDLSGRGRRPGRGRHRAGADRCSSGRGAPAEVPGAAPPGAAAASRPRRDGPRRRDRASR